VAFPNNSNWVFPTALNGPRLTQELLCSSRIGASACPVFCCLTLLRTLSLAVTLPASLLALSVAGDRMTLTPHISPSQIASTSPQLQLIDASFSDNIYLSALPFGGGAVRVLDGRTDIVRALVIGNAGEGLVALVCTGSG